MADNDELAKALNALAVAAKNPEGARNVLAMLFPKGNQAFSENEQTIYALSSCS